VTREQLEAAYRLGLARNDAKRARPGSKHLFGWTPTREEERRFDGMSVAAEHLVAEVTHRAWLSSGNTPDAPEDGDVEGGLCVRWTKLEAGCLLMHPKDQDHLYGVLVVGARLLELRVVGWRQVVACKEPQWWRERGVRFPAFFVPQGVLFHIDALSRWPVPPLSHTELFK
jgi:hypothetical protein